MPTGRTDAELCLIQLCDPRLDGSVEALEARVAQLEAKLAAGIPAAAPVAEEPLPELPPESVEETPVEEPEPSVEEDLPPWDLEPTPVEGTPTPEPVIPPEPVVETPVIPEPVEEKPASSQRPAVSGGDSQFWTQLAPQLRPGGGSAGLSLFLQPVHDQRTVGGRLADLVRQ